MVRAMDDSEVKPYLSDGVTPQSEFSRFWGNPRPWPRDPAGYVFLARAVHEIGRAKFGDEWVGDEPAIPQPDLKKYSTQAQYQELISKRERAAEVKAAIERACEAGALRTAVRAVAGGSMTSLERDVWNGERFVARWAECKIDIYDPFGGRTSGHRHLWIFVVRPDLDRLLWPAPPKQPDASANDLDGVHLSPYLKTMIEVARALVVAPDRQPKKEHVMDEIMKRWDHDRALSNNQVSLMATFIREPEAQIGRNPKKPTRKKS